MFRKTATLPVDDLNYTHADREGNVTTAYRIMNSTKKSLKKKNCKLAFTVNKGIAKMNKKNALTLERFDTNDLPLTC